MKLYGSLTSPYVRKVRMVLLEKNLPHEMSVEEVVLQLEIVRADLVHDLEPLPRAGEEESRDRMRADRLGEYFYFCYYML